VFGRRFWVKSTEYSLRPETREVFSTVSLFLTIRSKIQIGEAAQSAAVLPFARPMPAVGMTRRSTAALGFDLRTVDGATRAARSKATLLAVVTSATQAKLPKTIAR